MIFSHLNSKTLLACLKNYDILLNNGCKNSENIIRFRQECYNELQKQYDLYKEKPV